MGNDLKKLQAEKQFDKIKKLYDSADGVLTKNAIMEELWNKIAYQKTIRTFNFDGLNALKRYFNQSQLVGGIDELINVGFASREDFKLNDEWYKERYYPEVNAVWSVKLYEDKYLYSLSYQKMAQAFTAMQNYGNFLNELQDSIAQQKASTWYDRLVNIWQTNDNYVEVEVDAENMSDITGENLGKLITGISRKMTLPNSSYNKFGRRNATPYRAQNLVMDADAATTVDWDTAKIFNRNGIDGMGKLLSTDYVGFNDGRTIAILDTKEKIFIKEKYILPGVQPIIANKYLNMYQHEEYNGVVLPWVDGVRFVLKTKPKTSLDSVITRKELGELKNSEDATIFKAITDKNNRVVLTPDDATISDKTTTGATITAKPNNAKYSGTANITFTIAAKAK